MRELAFNLMASPGAAKTVLLEATIKALQSDAGRKLSAAVIEGDLETENDAERIRKRGEHHYHHDHSHDGDKRL